MSGSKTIIAGDDRLDNVHPGDILREDFLVGSDLSLAEVSAGTGIAIEAMAEIIANRRSVDAAVDARLTRYLGTSEGYFLRLQNSCDMEEVMRAEGDALERIIPRAA